MTRSARWIFHRLFLRTRVIRYRSLISRKEPEIVRTPNPTFIRQVHVSPVTRIVAGFNPPKVKRARGVKNFSRESSSSFRPPLGSRGFFHVRISTPLAEVRRPVPSGRERSREPWKSFGKNSRIPEMDKFRMCRASNRRSSSIRKSASSAGTR